MTHPEFFDRAPTITLRDPLSHFLGAFDDGLITYRYIDAVRLAGHSCPTVAAAFLMTRRALQLLYPDSTPERGAIQIHFSAAVDDGATGVTASVVSLITGAAGAGGFKGIGSHFRRQNLMAFGQELDAEARYERLDTGASVALQTQMAGVAADPRTMMLLKRILGGLAEPEDAQLFRTLWQERVQRMLIDHADDPELIVVTSPLAAVL